MRIRCNATGLLSGSVHVSVVRHDPKLSAEVLTDLNLSLKVESLEAPSPSLPDGSPEVRNDVKLPAVWHNPKLPARPEQR
jgi:hypothetical protein